MKKLFLLLVVILLTSFNVSAQFYLAPNGVTCMCPAANVGDIGVVNGVTYTKRTKEEITLENASTTCTSGITDMDSMFAGSNFNGDISSWDVSDVINLSALFGNSEFNGDISYWDVSNVIDTHQMFQESLFNQDISNWDVSNVINMNDMFKISQFNQDISNWIFNPNVILNQFITNSSMDTTNYDLLLQSFVDQNLSNKELSSDELTYCNVSARNNLINNKGWVILDDVYLPSNIIAPNSVYISPDVGTCIATNPNLGVPTIIACAVGSVTNDAPTEFPIGTTLVTWTLIDGNGVETTDIQNVFVELVVDIGDVCYVTSDDVDVTKNRIFLYNFDGLNVNSYTVSRETNVGGVYEVIGSIVPPANSFLDNTSNNTTQSYRYVLSTTDICGTTSEDSNFHETILLQVSIAADNSINLSWSPYIGTNYSTYNVFKQTNGGAYELLVSLSSTNTIYNDVAVDVTTDSYEYYVSIDVNSCVGEPFNPTQLKSNLGNIEPILSVSTTDEISKSIVMYPNPAISTFTIDTPNDVSLKEVRILNDLGQEVGRYKTSTINVENLSSGMYYVQIGTDKGTFSKRLLKK